MHSIPIIASFIFREHGDLTHASMHPCSYPASKTAKLICLPVDRTNIAPFCKHVLQTFPWYSVCKTSMMTPKLRLQENDSLNQQQCTSDDTASRAQFLHCPLGTGSSRLGCSNELHRGGIACIGTCLHACNRGSCRSWRTRGDEETLLVVTFHHRGPACGFGDGFGESLLIVIGNDYFTTSCYHRGGSHRRSLRLNSRRSGLGC